MGAAIGAQLAQLDAWWMPKLRIGEEPQGSREDRIMPHSIIVNRAGRRFVNEAPNYHDVCEAFGTKEGGWPRNLPAWLLFDRQAREKYILFSGKVPKGDPPPWLTVADSIEDLADNARHRSSQRSARRSSASTASPARAAIRTSARRERLGPRLGRSQARAQPLARHVAREPPFYAVEVMSGALATKGGLRVNAARARSCRQLPRSGRFPASTRPATARMPGPRFPTRVPEPRSGRR